MLTVGWHLDLRPGPLADEVAELRRQLAQSGLADAGDVGSPAALRSADVALVWADRPLAAELVGALADPAVRCLLAGPTLIDADPDGLLAGAAGLWPRGATPVHDVRVRASEAGGQVAGAPHSHGDHSHRDEHEHLTDRVVLVDRVAEDVAVLRVANVGLAAHPLMTWRPATATAAWTLGGTPGAVLDRSAVRALLQLVRLMGGVPAPAPVRVGLLGFGAIGHEHSRAVRGTAGLELAAVCDSSSERLARARLAAGGIATTTSGDALLERDDVDLVVVSTPPDQHAEWALRVVQAGKHVVLEKPFAIRTDEADEVLAAARASDRLAVVYQNRRFDPDHLALRRLVGSGAIGRVFRIEAFVGQYGHPCNLWHSDEAVSGGAFYDWGSHVIDQILDLVPAEVEHVSATTHKLRWFDVTNADHSRVTMRFTDGTRPSSSTPTSRQRSSRAGTCSALRGRSWARGAWSAWCPAATSGPSSRTCLHQRTPRRCSTCTPGTAA